MTAELAAVEAFLTPVLKRDVIVRARGQSVVERLLADNASHYSSDREKRAAVVMKAMNLLENMHHALAGNPDADFVRNILYTSTSRRVVDGLLDLISLEGIYPNILPGVGVPIERRLKTVLQGVTAIKHRIGFEEVLYDENLLIQVFESLSKVGRSPGKGLYGALQERTLVDIIAVGGQLAYGPDQTAPAGRYIDILNALLDETPTSTLFTVLTSLIHPAAPDWLKTHISKNLSLLPLRPTGVRDTIVFIASVTPQNINQSQEASGLMFSLEVFEHASRVLSSVPSTLSATAYFESVAPQLLALLDNEGTDLQRAAAYVIGNGILGRRQHGAPGRSGWNAFVDPISRALKPDFMINEMSNTDEDGFTPVVTCEKISCAVYRLAALTLIHPNPSLVKRLVGPLLLPVWCIVRQSHSITAKSVLHSKAMNILSTYFAVSVGSADLKRLVNDLLWDGNAKFVFSSNAYGKIEVYNRTGEMDLLASERELDKKRHEINKAVDVMVELQAAVQSDSDFMDVFLYSFEVWLLASTSEYDLSEISTFGFHQQSLVTAIDRYVNARMVQRMMEEYKERICANPGRILHLVGEILYVYANKAKEVHRSETQSKRISLVLPRPNRRDEKSEIEVEDEFSRIVLLSLSIVDLLVSQGIDNQPSTLDNIKTLQMNLDTLLSNTDIPKAITASVTFISSQISGLLAHPVPLTTDFRSRSLNESALAARSVAFQNLLSTLAPIRAEGLASLTTLIELSSPVLDVPATVLLLLSLLQDAEEYIYLGAVKVLKILAQKHPKTVIQSLMSRYIDREQDGDLDLRLRIGEALRSIVGPDSLLITEEVATLFQDGLIYIASRRVHRPKQAEERRKRKAMDDLKKKEAEEAWGGDTPSMEEANEANELSLRLQKILAGWEGQDGEEDIRIRTSALSILGVAIEAHIATLGLTFVSSAIDLAIAILKIERTDEKDILRRAAALLLMSVVKGLDTADERGRQLSFEFAGSSLGDIMEVIGYLAASEKDDIARGHEKEVLDGLQSWQTKRLLRAAGSGQDIRVGLEGKLKGLDVNPDADKRAKPRIEEVE